MGAVDWEQEYKTATEHNENLRTENVDAEDDEWKEELMEVPVQPETDKKAVCKSETVVNFDFCNCYQCDKCLTYPLEEAVNGGNCAGCSLLGSTVAVVLLALLVK